MFIYLFLKVLVNGSNAGSYGILLSKIVLYFILNTTTKYWKLQSINMYLCSGISTHACLLSNDDILQTCSVLYNANYNDYKTRKHFQNLKKHLIYDPFFFLKWGHLQI